MFPPKYTASYTIADADMIPHTTHGVLGDGGGGGGGINRIIVCCSHAWAEDRSKKLKAYAHVITTSSSIRDRNTTLIHRSSSSHEVTVLSHA